MLDAFAIAREEASDVELRYRMQGAAFMGAFFATSPLLTTRRRERGSVFEGIRNQLTKKFEAKGERSSRTTCASSARASTKCAK